MNRLSKDLKNINEKKIPEIYILLENLGKTGNNSNSQNLIKQGGELPMTRSRRNNARSILDNINNNIEPPFQKNEDNNDFNNFN